jgi:enediyne polyketide synthase
VVPDGPARPLDAASVYASLLFHGERFRRLTRYDHVAPDGCVARIDAGGAEPWFGRHLPQGLLLGDPAVRDAAIHAIQACVPGETLLPVSAARVVPRALPLRGPLTLLATRVGRIERDHVYDLELRDAGGALAETWSGLRLRPVRTADPVRALPLPLAEVEIERRLIERFPGCAVGVRLERHAPRDVRHRPDGRPEVDGPGKLSIAHSAGLTLTVSSARAAVTCDLERRRAWEDELARGMLGADGLALAGQLVQYGLPSDTARTIVGSAAECLRKAGAPPGAPLVAEDAGRAWPALRCGEARILAGPLELAGVPDPLVVAVLLRSEHALV